MKTSEFIEKALLIQGVGSYRDYGDYIVLKSNEGLTIADVVGDETHAFDNANVGFYGLDTQSRQKLFALLYQYAMTPLEEREESKKYKLEHKLVKGDYLNYVTGKEEWRLSTRDEIGRFKTSFTIQEWESLTEQTWEDLLLQFKAIEV